MEQVKRSKRPFVESDWLRVAHSGLGGGAIDYVGLNIMVLEIYEDYFLFNHDYYDECCYDTQSKFLRELLKKHGFPGNIHGVQIDEEEGVTHEMRVPTVLRCSFPGVEGDIMFPTPPSCLVRCSIEKEKPFLSSTEIIPKVPPTLVWTKEVNMPEKVN